jgi:molybdate transport system substrate-binding protein
VSTGRLSAWLVAAVLLGVLLPVGAEAGSRPRVLRVSAAASLSDAFDQAARAFERRNPGTTVRINLAGSQQLATQIELGARADVFASADQRWMDHLSVGGLLADAPVVFAHNRLVAIVPKANPARILQLQDLARPGVRLVLGADPVPVGRYARTMLRHLSRVPAFGPDFAGRVLHNVVSEEESVKSVVGKVQLGEADAGVVYRSDVTPAVARSVRVIAIPDSVNVLASYPMAVLRESKEIEAGRAFIAFIRSAEGRRVLERNGLTAPDSTESR